MKVKVDKTVLASVALHVVVLGAVMLSFSTKALEMPPEESVPVDVISSDQLAKVMAGMKTGKKENSKPLDYYLIPRSIFSSQSHRFTEKTIKQFGRFKLRSLAMFHETAVKILSADVSPMRKGPSPHGREADAQ